MSRGSVFRRYEEHGTRTSVLLNQGVSANATIYCITRIEYGAKMVSTYKYSRRLFASDLPVIETESIYPKRG